MDLSNIVGNPTHPPQIHQEHFVDPPFLTGFFEEFDEGQKTKVAKNVYLDPMELSNIVRNPTRPPQIHQEHFVDPPFLTGFLEEFDEGQKTKVVKNVKFDIFIAAAAAA